MSAETTTFDVSGRQIGKLVGGFNRNLERSADALVTRFGEETAAVMREEILDEYRRLIPEVPYIGGGGIAIPDTSHSRRERWRCTGW